jgi:hypothetical protein
MSIRGGFGISYDNWAAIIQMTQNYQGHGLIPAPCRSTARILRARSIPRRRTPSRRTAATCRPQLHSGHRT